MATRTDVDAIASSSATQSLTLTLDASGQNGVFAWFGPANFEAVFSSAFFDGVDVSAFVSAGITINSKTWRYLRLPTSLTGNKVLTINWATSAFTVLMARADTGVHATDPYPTVVLQDSPTTQPSFTVASAPGELVFAMFQENSGKTLTPGTGASFIGGFSGTFRHIIEEAGASSTVLDGTYSSGVGIERYSIAASTQSTGGGGTATVTGAGGIASGEAFGTATVTPTLSLYGIDFDDPALDLEIGNFAGTQVGLGLVASTDWLVRVRNVNTGAEVASDTLTTSAAGVLPRLEDAALSSAVYEVVGQTTEVDPLDRLVFAIIMQATL